ncbi:MAG: hypothetical protein L3J96_06505, partial [Thermoplasmata archaeon]|nr:hypothetical protein [Thermoplasmata archaeon]
MNAVVGRLRAWISGHERELALALGLTLLAVLTFLLRWEVLIQYPYPPSNDVGGDLYSAQQWLGNPIPGLWVDLQPPLYYWLVVIPAVHFLGPFAGPQVYMALVPALLVFPGYVFGRETGAGVVSSAVGAFGLAMATTLSLMVTWNGAYNALGILFLVLFATFLLRSLKRGRLVDSVAAGISLALVAGTHELSFLVGVIAFVVCAVLSLILVDRRRSTVRTVSIVLA